MKKYLVLIRHAATEKNKNNENRLLTRRGQLDFAKNISKLFALVDSKSTTIFTSNKPRALASANIIKKLAKINTQIVINDFRLQRIASIEKLIQKNKSFGIRPAQTYLDYISRSKNSLVEKPDQLIKRWDKYLKTDRSYLNILVSHECSLEAYFYFQNEYKIAYQSFSRYFDYSDFAILIKN